MAEENGKGPRIPRREKWVQLPEEYPGFEAQVWVNAPTQVWGNLSSPDEGVAMEAAKKLVVAHNGWLDFDGEPYPSPSDEAFWNAIPTELAACTLAAIQAEAQKLPNSMMPKPRSSRRG